MTSSPITKQAFVPPGLKPCRKPNGAGKLLFLTLFTLFSLNVFGAPSSDKTGFLSSSGGPVIDTTIEASICAGDTYVFGTQLLSITGSYLETFKASNGTDSIVNLLLTVLDPITTSLDVTICAGESYPFNGQSPGQSGVYTAVLTAENGCDSTVTLHLTILPAPMTMLSAAICEGSSYAFEGEVYTETGVYTKVLSAENGCDSFVVLNLSVVPFFETTIIARICPGQAYYFAGDTLTENGIYTDTLTAIGGCDSIFVLNLQFLPIKTTDLTVGICDSSFYVFHGDTLTVSGTYTDTLTAQNGCDSLVVLHLQVVPFFEIPLTVSICANETYPFGGLLLSQSGTYTDSLTAAGGCDSILVLTLTVLPLSPPTNLADTTCSNIPYIFNGTSLNQSGVYSAILKDINGCDSIIMLSLTVLSSPESSLEATICANQTYEYQGDTLSAAGVYLYSFPAENGCDSTVTLTLHVLPTPVTNLAASICEGTSLDFNGGVITTEGIYTATLTAENGCDSIINLDVTVLPVHSTDLSVSICANQSYEFGGESLVAAGTYIDTLTGQNGCDSVVTLVLDVLPTQGTNLEETICQGQSYPFNGDSLTASGNYTAVLTSENGCDSTVVLLLTVLDAPVTALSASVCEGTSYEYGTDTLTNAGVYTYVYPAANGCDSTVNFTLIVLPIAHTQLDVSICAGQSYEFAGDTLTLAGNYSDTLTAVSGCDSIVVLHLNVVSFFETQQEATICANETYEFGGESLNASGVYTDSLTSSAGCDSVVVLTLTVLPLQNTAVAATICANQAFEFNGQSLTLPGTYTVQLSGENGCDSLVTLDLSVLPLAASIVDVTICSNESYDFNGESLTLQGTYEAVLPAENGCDSTVTLNLTVLPVVLTETGATICANESYVFNGDTLQAAGTYTSVLTAENGCDSTVVLTLKVLPLSESTRSAQICSGTTYTLGGQILTDDGVYTEVFTGINGCDSLVTLNLTVADTLHSTFSAAICKGITYEFGGQALTESGEYQTTYTATGGCDSIVTLILNVFPLLSTDIQESICEGNTITFNGQILSTAGTYTAVYASSNGCDSTVTLTLTVNQPSESSSTSTICAGGNFDFNGQILTESGTYTAQLTNAAGCDSLVTLQLTVLPAVAPTTIEATICAGSSYDFNGEILNESGEYSATLSNAAGCDSTVTLVLTVLPLPQSELEASICEGNTYTYNNIELSLAGTYSFVFTSPDGCDSLVTLTLSLLPVTGSAQIETICAGDYFVFNGDTVSVAGSYTAVFSNSNGCDSTVTLNLLVNTVNTNVDLQNGTLIAQAAGATFQWINCDTNLPIPGAQGNAYIAEVSGNYAVIVSQNGCTATSACTFVEVVSTNQPNAAYNWTLQPNPAADYVDVVVQQIPAGDFQLELYDGVGRLLRSQSVQHDGKPARIDLNGLPEGVYLVKLSDGHSMAAKRLVKITE